MGQLVFRFNDEGVGRTDPQVPAKVREIFPAPSQPTAAEVAILRQILLEDELARATSPEARQQIHARFAAEERRRVRESR